MRWTKHAHRHSAPGRLRVTARPRLLPDGARTGDRRAVQGLAVLEPGEPGRRCAARGRYAYEPRAGSTDAPQPGRSLEREGHYHRPVKPGKLSNSPPCSSVPSAIHLQSCGAEYQMEI